MKIQKHTGFLARINGFLIEKKNRKLCKKNRKLIGFVAKQTGFFVKKIRKAAAVVASKKRLGWVTDRPRPKCMATYEGSG